MSRRLLLAFAAALLGGVLPGTASAGPERGFLVIEGHGGSSTEWVLAGEQTVILRDPLRPELTGGGPYTGVLIESLDGTMANRTGAVQVRAFADRTSGTVAPLAVDNQLEPGRYRVTLLGQGPVRVRYALDSEDRAGLRVVPSRRIPVTFLGRAEQLTFGQSSSRIEFPGAVAPGKRVVQVALLDGTAVDDLRMCATRAGACDQVLPLCPPAPAPCGDPGSRTARVGTGDPAAYGRLHAPAESPRTLFWSVNGYRDIDDRLRAAAIVF